MFFLATTWLVSLFSFSLCTCMSRITIPNFMLKSTREMRCAKRIDPTETIITHLYNFEKIKTDIETGSFDKLCSIVKQQLLCASYCSKRIPHDLPLSCDETEPLQKEKDEIRVKGIALIIQLKNWKNLYYYFLYRKLLQEAYEEGGDLIDCVRAHVAALNDYIANETAEDTIRELHAQVKRYHVQLTKKQVATLICYEKLSASSKNTYMVEHMHTLNAIAQTWFLIFDRYQDIITDLPESSTWDTTLAPYYEKCLEELYFLDCRQGRHDPIKDEMLSALSFDSFIWENLLTVAYHHLENAVEELDHPFLIPEDTQENSGKKLKVIWKECVLIIAQFLKNIGYCTYGPSIIEHPTVKDLRKALLIHAEIFAVHLRDGMFSYKLSPQQYQQLSIIQTLHALKPIPNSYSLILPSRDRRTRTHTQSLALHQKKLFSAPSSTITASYNASMHQLNSHESDSKSSEVDEIL